MDPETIPWDRVDEYLLKVEAAPNLSDFSNVACLAAEDLFPTDHSYSLLLATELPEMLACPRLEQICTPFNSYFRFRPYLSVVPVPSYELRAKNSEQMLNTLEIVNRHLSVLYQRFSAWQHGKAEAGCKDLTDESRIEHFRLTRREREILTLILCGYGARLVAQRLGISPRTVEAHVVSII